MMSKRKTIISLIFNAAAFVITVAVVISFFFAEPNILIQNGFDAFRYFTTDSNVLVAIFSLVVAVCDIRILAGKTDHIPPAVVMMKFTGTAGTTMTMAATLLFLLPHYGAFVISNSLFIVHVVTPLLALLSFVLLENTYHISFPKSFIGVIPMMMYGLVYMVEVAVIGEKNGGWPDFYAYNRSGQWLLSAVLMTAGCFVSAFATAALHNLAVKHGAAKQRP